MKLYVLDERNVWHEALIKSAQAHGFGARRILRGREVDAGGYGFIRCHAEPRALERNQLLDWPAMSSRLKMIQDAAQVEVYENKSLQFERWWDWMPPTWRFTSGDLAMQFLETATYPLVSKADVGASSVNVRILADKAQAQRHVLQLFTAGIPVRHCAGNAQSVQRGYVLLQHFIPHEVTWRVNAVGRCRAVFKRFNYSDRPVAQTGNVEPVMQLDSEIESLLEFSNRFLDEVGSKWCALDVLKDGDSWRLLETSLAWPWPSPGKCNSAPIFGSEKRWLDMFDVLMNEVEAGVFE